MLQEEGTDEMLQKDPTNCCILVVHAVSPSSYSRRCRCTEESSTSPLSLSLEVTDNNVPRRVSEG